MESKYVITFSSAEAVLPKLAWDSTQYLLTYFFVVIGKLCSGGLQNNTYCPLKEIESQSDPF